MGLTKKLSNFIEESKKQYKERQAELEKELPILIENAVDKIFEERIDAKIKEYLERKPGKETQS